MALARLTGRQRQIVEEFERRARHAEPPPTYRELCKMFDWASTGTARDHLKALERKGVLSNAEGLARGYALAQASYATVALLGEVVAGNPALAIEQAEDFVHVPATWIDSKSAFALRVRGDSMQGAGILQGDTVLCSITRARPGRIVVATVDGETTLKRLRKDRRGRYWLDPENDHYDSVAIDTANAHVQGVVVALLREYRTFSNRGAR